jgi:hypothetical protein
MTLASSLDWVVASLRTYKVGAESEELPKPEAASVETSHVIKNEYDK